MVAPMVIKIGGNEIDDPGFLDHLAEALSAVQVPVVIVHGGGKEISHLQQVMGIEPRYLEGVRITDAPSLAIVEMVLCGTVNTRLVRRLVAAGIDALGMSGVDRGLMTARPMQREGHDMGFTGEVEQVRGHILLDLLAQGVTPVIAPISLGPDSAYNVNADHAAGAIAASIGASKVIFLTNVEGVLVNGAVVAGLTSQRAHDLIQDGTIFGGMIPKVQTALHALASGVPEAVITNLKGLQTQGGTAFTEGSRG